MKNIAATWNRCNVPTIEGTPALLAPASNVSATMCRAVGMKVISMPAHRPGHG